MSITPKKEYRFGQSFIKRNGDAIIKSFYNKKDYYQEKYFLDLLWQERLDFIPSIISTNDLKYEIVTPYYGESLDNIDWRAEKLKWFCRIANLMEKVWTIKTPIVHDYKKFGKSAFRFVEKYLSDGSRAYMVKAGIEQDVIDQSADWLKKILINNPQPISTPRLIHFDLSPGNILAENDSLYIIDWSRAMYSELSIEISIMREKFETIGQPLNCNSWPNVANLDINFIDNMAKCFSIYRKAKKIGATINKQEYLKFLETTISSK